MKAPLILGAGPAGSMAAIHLARAGTAPVLVDRDPRVGDALCGGFLSWRTAERLRAVGLDPVRLGTHTVSELALYGGSRVATAGLPQAGYGVSRRALDGALRDLAVEAGAQLAIERIRAVAPRIVEGENGTWHPEAVFLASGKHDVRGAGRPRVADDPALGLRVRLPPAPALHALLRGRIELHLFRGGYAGIVLQEDGSANVCLAVRKSLLARFGGNPQRLLDSLADEYPPFAERMAHAPPGLPVDTVGAVPYGYIARATTPGVYRLGDQAAVIPSMAGEGMGIAVASGALAARAWLGKQGAPEYQRAFAGQVRRPVRAAQAIWALSETPAGAALMARATRIAPALARGVMALTRL
ncbi:NAD(P)/FAD-dependent oxidoreductase [Tsuneonella aeria]|uniref:NAD(P)/FAD-dependent oxidoreductase n=1 Tax=Tsuneonella aeria TaxID=1837929 RepID=UPI003B218267